MEVGRRISTASPFDSTGFLPLQTAVLWVSWTSRSLRLTLTLAIYLETRRLRTFSLQRTTRLSPTSKLSNEPDTMRSILHTLLLATLFTLCVLAVPVPMSDDEIQARWKRGESEVGCLPNGAGCYVLAWWRSLSPRNVVRFSVRLYHHPSTLPIIPTTSSLPSSPTRLTRPGNHPRRPIPPRRPARLAHARPRQQQRLRLLVRHRRADDEIARFLPRIAYDAEAVD